jgi:hypothetical protein
MAYCALISLALERVICGVVHDLHQSMHGREAWGLEVKSLQQWLADCIFWYLLQMKNAELQGLAPGVRPALFALCHPRLLLHALYHGNLFWPTPLGPEMGWICAALRWIL